jgi:hypothetical protein
MSIGLATFERPSAVATATVDSNRSGFPASTEVDIAEESELAAAGWLRRPGLLLGLILLVAILVRAPGLGAESFWTDEFFSLVESSGYSIVIWPPPGWQR